MNCVFALIRFFLKTDNDKRRGFVEFPSLSTGRETGRKNSLSRCVGGLGSDSITCTRAFLFQTNIFKKN